VKATPGGDFYNRVSTRLFSNKFLPKNRGLTYITENKGPGTQNLEVLPMSKALTFFYSIVCYLFFLGIFLYAVGFVGNLIVPRSIDVALSATTGTALLINALLLGLFALQHTIMARPRFKSVITKIIPEAAERSTYVLLTCLVMGLMFWQWRAMPGDIWLVENVAAKNAIEAVFWIGWLIVLSSTFMINHFDLFGLRQSWLSLRGKPFPAPIFQTTGLYKFVRHPIMFGFILAFWATPHMTLGHLVFAISTTGYILMGLWFEERDLVADLGEDYLQYRRQVSKLIPWVPKSPDSGPSAADKLVKPS
jgi:protein-S-isoprenylcysteine O-methyltransferase Ste14